MSPLRSTANVLLASAPPPRGEAPPLELLLLACVPPLLSSPVRRWPSLGIGAEDLGTLTRSWGGYKDKKYKGESCHKANCLPAYLPTLPA